MVLERNRVDYVNGPTSSSRRRYAKQDAVDRLVRVFEGMKDEFGVGEVGELKAWARHAAKSSGGGGRWVPARRRDNLDTLLHLSPMRHSSTSLFFSFFLVFSVSVSLCLFVPISLTLFPPI